MLPPLLSAMTRRLRVPSASLGPRARPSKLMKPVGCSKSRIFCAGVQSAPSRAGRREVSVAFWKSARKSRRCRPRAAEAALEDEQPAVGQDAQVRDAAAGAVKAKGRGLGAPGVLGGGTEAGVEPLEAHEGAGGRGMASGPSGGSASSLAIQNCWAVSFQVMDSRLRFLRACAKTGGTGWRTARGWPGTKRRMALPVRR